MPNYCLEGECSLLRTFNRGKGKKTKEHVTVEQGKSLIPGMIGLCPLTCQGCTAEIINDGQRDWRAIIFNEVENGNAIHTSSSSVTTRFSPTKLPKKFPQ